jgi:phosphoribosylformylglycinamidine (FGAM) synthase-like amidotransferase family enzyme
LSSPTIALAWVAGGGDLGAELGASLRELAPKLRLVMCPAGAPIEGDAAVITEAAPDGDEDATAASLRAFAGAGGWVLGIGPGVAMLCAARLLAGRIEPASAAVAPRTHVRVEGRATSFTWAIPAGRVLEVDAGVPSARYVDPDPAGLESAGRVVLRYCDGAGGIDGDSVAGVCDAEARVVGLLPGVAPAARALGGNLGRQLLGSLCMAARGAWR